LAALEQRVEVLERSQASADDSVCIVVYSGTLDKLLATMNIATGAAAMGCKVRLFFTFWGTAALRNADGAAEAEEKADRNFMDKMMGWMLPSGPSDLKLSTMNMWGMGKSMIRKRMKEQGAADLDELFQMARDCDVEINVCEMSMNLLGLSMEDLCEHEGIKCCGVGTFLGYALDSKVTLFV